MSCSRSWVPDEPASTVRGAVPAAIHHEPGLLLNMLNRIPDGFDIARLATIPRGDAALALGTSSVVDANPYLAPYRHFRDHPFKGTLGFPGFPGFDPTAPHELLLLSTRGQTVARTTVLDLETTHPDRRDREHPVRGRAADPASMRSTFWVQELAPDDAGTVELQPTPQRRRRTWPRTEQGRRADTASAVVATPVGRWRAT